MATDTKQGLEAALADVNDLIRITEKQIASTENSSLFTAAEKAPRLAALRAELAGYQAQQTALTQQLNQLNLLENQRNTASSADTTAQAQTARDDSANTSAAPVAQKETGPDGRVVTKSFAAPTNADAPKTVATGDTDFGTNAPTRTITETQSSTSAGQPADPPVAVAAATIPQYDPKNPPRVEVNGVGSRGDDAAPTVRPTVVNRLDELYAGSRNAIISQDNILDQFGSYTYSLSWYLLDPVSYNRLLTSDVKSLDNYTLLAQSGGAPLQTTNQSYVQTTSTGRSPFFTLDYYLDNFEFETRVSGTPGTRGAATLTGLSFTLTEPNGISLISNLVKAVNALYFSKGLVKKGTTVNYSEAQYCMVIRFYGYDSKGNLVIPINQRQGVTDRQAAIEKFIPFKLTGIEFKVANKLVEYAIKGATIPTLTAFSTDRGSIPQNFQFQGSTVKDILVGTSKNLTRSDLAIRAAEQAAATETAATRENLNQDSSDNRFARTLPPPPKASAIPYRVGNTEATGLCAALNLFFAEEAKKRGGIADIYEIQFLDPILSNASIVPPGPVDKALAGGNSQNTASAQIDPNRQSLDPSLRIRSCTAGQQVVQFIDEVMRSSSYISDQQNAKWELDPKTNKGKWVYNKTPNKTFAWFDISCEAQWIGYDENARCNAYRMIYRVAPYQTVISSEYFAPGEFRGVHKVYNYWFTGQNTQVLQYEQSFNHLWTQTISSNGPTQQQTIRNKTNSRLIWSKRFQPASNQTREGAEGNVYEAAANAADILYTTDLAKISLNIIGDPAWIPIPKNPQPGAFVVTPFYPDGTVNYAAGAPYFEFAWNRPVDYNLQTGLMDPGQNNYFSDRENGRAGLAQESVIYQTLMIKSKFIRGKFTQQLDGNWLFDGQDNTTPAKAAAVAASTENADVAAFTGQTDEFGGLDAAVASNNANDLSREEANTAASNYGNEGNRVANQAIPISAGVEATAQASVLNQYPSSPTAQSPGNVITGETIAAPRPAVPPPIQPTELAAVAAPPKLGGFGSGANNPSLAVTSAAPQIIAQDA
jgi:hypothetical protein